MELIKIKEDNGKKLVSARELYEFLEVSERFNNWFERQVQYGFIENEDFTGCKIFNTLAKQDVQEFIITLDMAKEISMLQRSEKGKEARRYFIECEKQLLKNNIPQTYAEALLEAGRLALELENANKQIIENKPKVEYCENVLNTESSYTTTQIAKELEMSAVQLNVLLSNLGVQFKQSGQWMLTSKYQDKGYTKVRTHLLNKDITKHSTVWTEKGRKFLLELSEEF